MSKSSSTASTKYVPKHRAPGKHKAKRAVSRTARTGVLLTGGIAVAVTAASVSGGVFTGGSKVAPAAADLSQAAAQTNTSTQADPSTVLQSRAARTEASRSQRRTDPAKETALSMAEGTAVTKTENLADGDPREIAQALLPTYGFSSDQFSCLDALYVSESGWRINADNPSSSAYGIPQALTQLHDLPADYMTSAESQIRWGLEYIQRTYGTPCSAWSFKQGHGWY